MASTRDINAASREAAEAIGTGNCLKPIEGGKFAFLPLRASQTGMAISINTAAGNIIWSMPAYAQYVEWATFAVRAINAHEAISAALETMIQCARYGDGQPKDFDAAESALRLARGENV